MFSDCGAFLQQIAPEMPGRMRRQRAAGDPRPATGEPFDPNSGAIGRPPGPPPRDALPNGVRAGLALACVRPPRILGNAARERPHAYGHRLGVGSLRGDRRRDVFGKEPARTWDDVLIDNDHGSVIAARRGRGPTGFRKPRRSQTPALCNRPASTGRTNSADSSVPPLPGRLKRSVQRLLDPVCDFKVSQEIG